MISAAILACAPSGGSAPYQGPLDLVPGALVAYSQRAMAAAWVSNAITIRRDSNDATQNFATTTANAVDPAAVSAFIGVGNGFATAWKDQSGHVSDAVQATAAQQPQWIASTQGSKPGLRFVSNDGQFLVTAGNVTIPTGECTIFAVIKHTDGNFGSFCGMNNATGTPGFFVSLTNSNAFNTAIVSAGPLQAGMQATNAPADAYALIDFALAFGTHALDFNGVSQSVTANDVGGAPASVAFPLAVGDDDGAGFDTPWDGDIIELLVYPMLLSISARNDVRQNIADYYGITLP